MDDVRAVMDAVDSERAVLWAAQEGTRIALLFAATYPERTSALVLYDPTARGLPGSRLSVGRERGGVEKRAARDPRALGRP